MENNYVLFTEDLHDNIKWSHTEYTMRKFRMYWKFGYHYKHIGKKLFLNNTEVLLIMIDQMTLGMIPDRKGGALGFKDPKFKLKKKINKKKKKFYKGRL